LCSVFFLEKSTKKTSANSSIPPSQTGKDETTPPNTKTNGKGHEETSTTIENTRTVEIITTIVVDSCNTCGEDLSQVPCVNVERRTRIDIVFEKTVEHVDAEIKECPSCQSRTKGAFPEYMAGPLQYGNGIKAFIVQLLVTQMISLNRTAKMVATLIGQLLSEATMLGYIMRLHVALEAWEADARLKLLASPCMNSDETSCRVDKKNWWIHVYSSGDITLKFLHRKRGKEAIDDIGHTKIYWPRCARLLGIIPVLRSLQAWALWFTFIARAYVYYRCAWISLGKKNEKPVESGLQGSHQKQEKMSG